MAGCTHNSVLSDVQALCSNVHFVLTCTCVGIVCTATDWDSVLLCHLLFMLKLTLLRAGFHVSDSVEEITERKPVVISSRSPDLSYLSQRNDIFHASIIGSRRSWALLSL